MKRSLALSHDYFEVSSLTLSAIGLAILPCYPLRLNLGPIPVTLPELLLWLAISIWIVLVLATKIHPNWPTGWWAIIAIAWLGAALLGLIVAKANLAALGIFKAYFLLPVGLYFYWFDMTTRHRWQYWLGYPLLISALIVAAVGLLQATIQWPNLAPHELLQGRISATYNTANAIGLYLGPIIIAMAAYLFHSRKSKGLKWVIAATINLLLIITVILSRSEGSNLALIIAVMVIGGLIWLHQTGRLKKLSFSVQTAISGVVMATYLLGSLSYFIWFNHPPQVQNPYTRPNFSTMTVRQCLWQGTMNSLRQDHHWIWGNGLNGFTSHYLQHYTCDAEPLVYPHNIILNTWSELGLMGLVALIATLTLVLARSLSWLAGSRDETVATSAFIIIGALTYWLAHGLVDVPYFKNDLSVMWWAVLALAAITEMKHRRLVVVAD